MEKYNLKKYIPWVLLIAFVVFFAWSNKNNTNNFNNNQYIIDSLKNENIILKDSININKSVVIKQEINVASLEKAIKKLDSKLYEINEKLKEDTSYVNYFNNDELEQFLLSR